MKIGFIGMGNMAQALAQGFKNAGLVRTEDMYAFAPNQTKLAANAEKIGFIPMPSAKELVKNSEMIIMACKPYQIESVLCKLGDALNGKALVSVAAGWDFEKYSRFLDPSVRVQFVMPSTPAMVGEGVLLFEDRNTLLPEEREEVMRLMDAVGMVEVLPSRLMGIGGAVTGCGPAFVDMMMEAYADAAVKYGIQRQTAYRLVSQMVLGAAKLQMVTGEHPGSLKDKVCSPGGTTICGVASLEEDGLRSACIHSIDAVMSKK